MTLHDDEATADRPSHWLGRSVVRRMRLPGPPLHRPLPSRIGSLASGVSRFAMATSRPVEIRRALAGPDPAFGGAMRPPRWWVPRPAAEEAAPDVASSGRPTAARSVGGGSAQSLAARKSADAAARVVRRRDVALPVVRRSADSGASADPRPGPAPAAPWLAPSVPAQEAAVSRRGLPRAARSVPHEETYSPGGLLAGLVGEVARVRRYHEVLAAGPMLGAADRARLRRTPAQAAAAPPPPTSIGPAMVAAVRESTSAGTLRAPAEQGSGEAGEPDRGLPAPASSSAPAPGTSHDAAETAASAPQVRSSPRVSLPHPPGARRTRFVETLRRTPAYRPSSVAILRTASTASGERGVAPTVSAPRAVAAAAPALIATAAPSVRPESVAVGLGRARRDRWASESLVMRQSNPAPAAPPAAVVAAPATGAPAAARTTTEEHATTAAPTGPGAMSAIGAPAAVRRTTGEHATTAAPVAPGVRPAGLESGPASAGATPTAVAASAAEPVRVGARTVLRPSAAGTVVPLTSGARPLNAATVGTVAPDLLSIRRVAGHGVGAGTSLASGFGPATDIRPATASRARVDVAGRHGAVVGGPPGQAGPIRRTAVAARAWDRAVAGRHTASGAPGAAAASAGAPPVSLDASLPTRVAAGGTHADGAPPSAPRWAGAPGTVPGRTSTALTASIPRPLGAGAPATADGPASSPAAPGRHLAEPRGATAAGDLTQAAPTVLRWAVARPTPRDPTEQAAPRIGSARAASRPAPAGPARGAGPWVPAGPRGQQDLSLLARGRAASPATSSPAVEGRQMPVAPPRGGYRAAPPPVPVSAGREAAGDAATPGAPAALGPARAHAAAGGPVPVPGTAPGPGPTGSTPASLVHSTAHLFAAAADPGHTAGVPVGAPPLATAPAGMLRRLAAQEGRSPMSAPSALSPRGEAAEPSTRSAVPEAVWDVAGAPPVAPPGVLMDELVDAVVDRIERKVVDELERRGQRRGWGAF